jgi:hypothetical protein
MDSDSQNEPMLPCSYKWGKSSEHFGDRHEGCFKNVSEVIVKISNHVFVLFDQHGQSNGPGITYFLDGAVHYVTTTSARINRSKQKRHLCTICCELWCRVNSKMERWRELASEYFKMGLAMQARGKMIYCMGKLCIWALWMPSERLSIYLKKVLAFQQGSLTVALTGTPSRHHVEDSKLQRQSMMPLL